MAEAGGSGLPVAGRLVVCQGSIQYLAAAAALRTRGPAPDGPSLLVVADLHVPSDQQEGFVRVISDMAKATGHWDAIVHLPTESLDAWRARVAAGETDAVLQDVRERIGAGAAQEVYAGRAWQFANRLLLRAYEGAHATCTGDGIGIWFTPDAAVTGGRERSALGRWWKHLSRRLRGRSPGAEARLGTPTFDDGAFALPDAFGETPPMPHVRIAPESMRTLVARCRPLADPEDVARLRNVLAHERACILLTANLSEAGWMTPDDEAQAYAEWLEDVGVPRDVPIAIKPHPRDGAAKLERVAEHLRGRWDRVEVLSAPARFGLPFEVLLDAAREDAASAPRVLAVSSAGLSLEWLFGLPTELGLGADVVRRRFRPERIRARLAHEEQLRVARAIIREGR